MGLKVTPQEGLITLVNNPGLEIPNTYHAIHIQDFGAFFIHIQAMYTVKIFTRVYHYLTSRIPNNNTVIAHLLF
jgi:hypothetical protein